MSASSSPARHVAVDLGASSGRVAIGEIRAEKLHFEVVHRFSNRPLMNQRGMCWDYERLWEEVLTGLRKAMPFATVGVDSWAVDYGLFDAGWRMLGGIHHYRDPRTKGLMEAVDQAEVYAETGIQFLPFNTLYQLMADRRDAEELFWQARHLLMIPDLFHHWLCGSRVTERTNASTTQLYNPRTRTWSSVLSGWIGADRFLPEIVEPGTVLGELLPPLELGHGQVIAPATHDTASAVAAVPAEGDDWGYVSSGTWSLVGIETPEPVISDAAREANITNEAGINGTTRLLKNMAGLWILQECRRAWNADYDELYQEAEHAKGRLFDPDDPRFTAPGTDMPERVASQIGECSRAEMVRSILDSLAAKTAEILDVLESVSGRKIRTVHIVGGGSQIALLNQLIATASLREVIAGPVEATLMGNLLMQAEAYGSIAKGSIRQMVKDSTELTRYSP